MEHQVCSQGFVRALTQGSGCKLDALAAAANLTFLAAAAILMAAAAILMAAAANLTPILTSACFRVLLSQKGQKFVYTSLKVRQGGRWFS